MNVTENRPVIGISCGDLNGVGTEIIIKTLGDTRILDFCTPIVFATNKVINFYKKALPDIPFNYLSIKELNRVNHKQINVFNCWEEEVAITPGIMNDTGGKYGIKSFSLIDDLYTIEYRRTER